MAERWQQWMPFHIDKFRGSPEVQAMHPAARLGYIYLLAAAWQSSDCTVSADPLDLATDSGLGDEMWALYGARILRKFTVINGRLRNEVLFAEWSDALRVYEKRKKGAVRTNKLRSPSAVRTQSERPADTQTVTGTTTGTETKDKEPLASTAVAVSASPPFITLPLLAGKTHIVTQADVGAWAKAYPAVDIRQELQKVLVWLDAHPAERSTSISGSKQRIVRWMTRAQDKGGSGNGTNRSDNRGQRRVDSQLEALQRANALDRQWSGEAGADSGMAGRVCNRPEGADGGGGAGRVLEGAVGGVSGGR